MRRGKAARKQIEMIVAAAMLLKQGEQK